MTVLAETPSTMGDAAAALKTDPALPLPHWIRAERQTAGVGRRGRAWVHDPRNLAATLIAPVPAAVGAHPAFLSFWPGLALLDAMAEVAPERAGDGLKWPNDILDAKGRKLCGILPQFRSGLERAVALIGIGANLAVAPEGAGTMAPGCSPAGFLPILHRHLVAWWRRYEAEGFGVIREAWLTRAVGVGQPITVRLSAETREGVFHGLATDGALLLTTKTGTERILAADIFLAALSTE